jgi:hypothetical protein
MYRIRARRDRGPFVQRFSLSFALAVVMTVTAPPGLVAQDPPEFIAGLGGGMSLYGISTRFDDGTILRGSLGYSPIPWLVLEAGARWHGCFDCDRFSILEGGVQFRRPGSRFSPFVSAGGGRSSDPEFMGSEWGFHVAAGSWLWLSDDWGLQVEARGRQVGPGDHMGEFTAGVARRFRAPGG